MSAPRGWRPRIAWLWACALLLAAALPLAGQGPATVGGVPADQALVLGERMYRQGILPSGKPVSAVVNGDMVVEGTAFTCVSCHLRGGLGSWEGGIVTLPTNGARLFIPRYWKFPNLSLKEREELKLQNPPARPAHTDETLAHLLRTGRDPGGNDMHRVMPRYDLSDPDMAILIHYLRNLSAKPSPGVDGQTLRFATVITPGASASDERSFLVPIQNYVARHNQFSAGFGNRMYLAVGGNEMSGAYRKLALSVWRLQGAPETWDAQLKANLAKEPVFALLGGLGVGDWKPVHAFCEEAKLPCLFPLTDLPVVSDSDWYTLYFSKGYYQEGAAAARYLNSLQDPAPAQRPVQVVQDTPEGRALARGFRETWAELGRPAAPEVLLPAGEVPTAASLKALQARDKATTLLLWAGPGALAPLSALAPGARPAFRIFLSGRQLGGQHLKVPEPVRAATWITWPYRDPKDEPRFSKFADTLLAGLTDRHPETRISTRAYSMVQVLRQTIMDMDRHFYRDNFLDRIGMQRDHQELPDFLRLSFGPGQRYASKGCFIMQVGPGASPELVRKSEWVIH